MKPDEFAEAIRPELQMLPVPAPNAEVLNRILTSRQSGARVILPDVSVIAARSNWRIIIPASIVAALLLIALPLRRSPTPSGADASSFASTATEWLPGSVAFAQTDAARSARKAPPMMLTRPSRIHAMRLQYVTTWRDSTHREIGRVNRLTSVEGVLSGGVPGWLVVTRSDGAPDGRRSTAIDSIVVGRENLSLMRQISLERPYSRYTEIRIDQTFRGDSIVGRMHAKGADATAAGRPIARKLSSANGPYIIDGLAPIILGAASVNAGWSASASIVGWAVRDDDVFTPIELHVDGSETITVPAGRFDCWRITIRFTRGALTYWSRKSDGVGVKSLQRDAKGITREKVLVGES
jgi:hypothetical protein